MRDSIMSRCKNTSPYYWLNTHPQEVEYLALVLRKNFRGVAYSLAIVARSLPGAHVPDATVLTEYKRVQSELQQVDSAENPPKVSLNLT